MKPLTESDVVLRDGVETVSVKRLREVIKGLGKSLEGHQNMRYKFKCKKKHDIDCEVCYAWERYEEQIDWFDEWFGGVQQK